ncbi:MAG: iron chelate uptake ABC transporter family permease subunit, partial [Terriglobia bacterium]
MLTRKKIAAVLLLLLLVLAGMMGMALSIGSTHIPPVEVVRSVWALLAHPRTNPTAEVSTILFSLRMPRIYLAMLVGMALAVAGASFQALLRNPLADPHILGVSSGAALAAILSIALAGRWGIPTPIAAFVGGLITIVLVYT